MLIPYYAGKKGALVKDVNRSFSRVVDIVVREISRDERRQRFFISFTMSC